MSVKTKIQIDAERLVKEGRTTWQKMYFDGDSDAVETLMRSGHIARFYPDYEPSNPSHQEALATIASVYA